MNYEIRIKELIFALLLIFLAIGERLWFDLGPNIELVTVVTLIAAYYINRRAALLVALVSLAVSDIVLGNTSISLFTWSAYFFIAIGAYVSRRWGKGIVKKGIVITFTGVVASILFYWWTNFGVWLLDSWGMYPKTLAGLLSCYVNAIPFFKNQLLSNLLLVPLGYFLVESLVLLKNYLETHQSSQILKT